MRSHGVTEVIIFPLDDDIITTYPEFCPIFPINIRKTTTLETEDGIVMNRLGILND